MYRVKVKWLLENEGGRKQLPPNRQYYATSRFLDENGIWDGKEWSVFFEFDEPIIIENRIVSFGFVDFLMDTAPKDKMIISDFFDIYEGPKKVANVFLIKE